jgi:plastocyanin
VLAVASGLAACGADPDLSTATVVRAHTPKSTTDSQMAFDLDRTSVPAGRVRFEFTNEGSVAHQYLITQLNDGVTLAQAEEVAKSNDLQALLGGKKPLVTSFGGSNTILPGVTESTERVLQPGTYVVMCLLPDEADPKLNHSTLGMIHELTVTDNANKRAKDPVVAAEVDLKDFSFTFPPLMQAGAEVTVRNDGTQPHEFALFKIDDKTSITKVVAQLNGTDTSTPVFAPVPGGSTLMSIGQDQVIRLPDEPGTYLAACFMPYTEDGVTKPHFDLGMIAKFTIEKPAAA